MKTSQPRHKRAGNGAGSNGVAPDLSVAAGFTGGSRPTQRSQREPQAATPAVNFGTPTIDWVEVKRLSAISEQMCKLILAATNQAATATRTNRKGKEYAAQVVKLVAEWFGYDVKDLRSKPRPAALAWARQVAAYFCTELTVATCVEIGELLQKHHGIVNHACKVVVNRMETEPRTKSDLDYLRAHLEARLK